MMTFCWFIELLCLDTSGYDPAKWEIYTALYNNTMARYGRRSVDHAWNRYFFAGDEVPSSVRR